MMSEFLTDTEREALWQALGGAFSCAPNSEESTHAVDAAVQRIVRDREAAAVATVAHMWQTGGWSAVTTSPYSYTPSAGMTVAQAVTDWLNARAAEVRGGQS